MPFPFYIARRYLFARKSHHAINIISIISVLGIAVATMAMVCVLSIFNGFHGLVASLFTAFDPELKILPVEGKTFVADEALQGKIKQLDCVDEVSATLEQRALARYNGRQAMVVLKGVDDNFSKITDISRILYGPGRFLLHADVMEFGIPGLRLANNLGMDADYIDPLLIYTPAAGARINLMAPDESFNLDELNSPGVVFSVGQKKYDQEYILCSLPFAQRMFDKDGEIGSLEIKLRYGTTPDKARNIVQQAVGDKFRVVDRYQQQEDVFRIMKVEKYLAYFFLTFILFIACFNIVGSLSMLIIEKKKDVITLRNLGATNQQIQKIFLFEGRMISLSGAIIGIIAGLVLCALQQQYGFLKLCDKTVAFIIDAYPVIVNPWDIVIIFATVVIVSFLVSWYPVHYISKQLTNSSTP